MPKRLRKVSEIILSNLCKLTIINDFRLSVCPMPDPKSTTEGRMKLKIGRKEATTWVTCDSI